ncbi:MAG: DUF1287 domain-containing protein [Pseudomonadales bacterium]
MKKKFLFVTILVLSQNGIASSFQFDLVQAALERTRYDISYDGSYFSIAYPNGDVPANIGVCTDVVIRSYRALGTDLQVLVHEDMVENFDAYPSRRIWGLHRTDKNIDHRRVPNLRAFFSRHGKALPVTRKNQDYKPGDIVTWALPGNLPHIGIVSDSYAASTGTPLIVHNIGSGPTLDDILFSYKITGHYRYVPKKYRQLSKQVIEPLGELAAKTTSRTTEA